MFPFPSHQKQGGLAYPGQLDVLIPWVLERSRNVYHFQVTEEGIWYQNDPWILWSTIHYLNSP